MIYAVTKDRARMVRLGTKNRPTPEERIQYPFRQVQARLKVNPKKTTAGGTTHHVQYQAVGDHGTRSVNALGIANMGRPTGSKTSSKTSKTSPKTSGGKSYSSSTYSGKSYAAPSIALMAQYARAVGNTDAIDK